MATQRDAENNHFSLNACESSYYLVLIVTPRFLGIAKLGMTVRQLLLLCSRIAQELSSNSTHDIAESHRRLSEQRVVSGMTGCVY
jgi:hypothetical protein